MVRASDRQSEDPSSIPGRAALWFFHLIQLSVHICRIEKERSLIRKFLLLQYAFFLVHSDFACYCNVTDVAIGAPGETDGSSLGAVYIHMGSSSGLVKDYAQRIVASSITNAVVQGFGYTMGYWWDVDEDGFNGENDGACAHFVMVTKSEAILACHPARFTEWPGWVGNSCELWRIRTGPIEHKAAKWWRAGHTPTQGITYMYMRRARQI